MSENAFPLNDVDYLAEDLRRWFVGRSPGILNITGSDYAISSAGGMLVNVNPGQCYLWTDTEGSGGIMHWTDVVTQFQADVADTIDRYDYIAIRYEKETNQCTLQYVKGNSQKPTPVRTSNTWEIIVGYFLVPANAGEVTATNITDTRLNTTYCGLTVDTLSDIPTDVLNNQFNAFMTEIAEQYETQFNTQANRSYAQLQEISNQFNEWWGSAKDSMDGDVAGNLLLKIQALEDRIPTMDLGEIVHNLGTLVHVFAYEYSYGAGIGGAGEGPAGGTGLVSSPCEYTTDADTVTPTVKNLGEVESINQVDTNNFAVVYKDSVTNLLISINPNTPRTSDDVNLDDVTAQITALRKAIAEMI